jgi:hypothetical protein
MTLKDVVTPQAVTVEEMEVYSVAIEIKIFLRF